MLKPDYSPQKSVALFEFQKSVAPGKVLPTYKRV